MSKLGWSIAAPTLIVVLFGVISAQGSLETFIINRFDDDSIQFDRTSGIPYKNCGGDQSVIKKVTLTPCNEITKDNHCVLQKGQNATFQMTFVPLENSKSLKVKLYLDEFFPVPIPSPEPDACKNSGIKCPIVKGELYNYSLSAPISKTYPDAKFWVKGELKDDDDKTLTCVEIAVKLV